MLEALQKFSVDRNTIYQTAASADLAIAAPEKYRALLQQQKEGKASKHCKEKAGSCWADKVISNNIRQTRQQSKHLPEMKD